MNYSKLLFTPGDLTFCQFHKRSSYITINFKKLVLKEFQEIDDSYNMILSSVQDGLRYFQCNPLFKDHLSCETTLSWQKRWSLMTGFIVVGTDRSVKLVHIDHPRDIPNRIFDFL